MRLPVDQLAHRLTQQFPRVLLLNGNETLLVEEALDSIRQASRQAGFTERLCYTVEGGFDWAAVSQAEQTLSLFAEARCIELRIPTAKPGDKGAQFINGFCQSVAADDTSDTLIIISGALTAQQRKTKWVKTVDQAGWVVDCMDVKAQQLPNWLKQRLQSRALRVEAGVVDMLAYALEGNLLAAAQTVEQLTVLSPDKTVTLELLQQTLADQSRFSVYNLVDSCLLGVPDTMLHQLQRIRSEEDNCVLIVWALARELRNLIRMATDIDNGSSVSHVMQQHRVWSSRQRMVSSALHRLSLAQLQAGLQQLSQLDAIVKGQRPGDSWHELEKLCLSLCGIGKLEESNTMSVAL